MSPSRALADPRFRQVVKVVLAAVVAFVLSMGHRNEYALFAALGAAMVVGGSIGEDLKASLNRVRGTLAGTGIGIVLAQALGTSIASLGLCVLCVAWLAVGLGWGAPAMRIGLAMALVVLFTHTSDAIHYALWRAGNTLIGVAVGLAVSRLVWPILGRDEIRAALAQVTAATASVLESLSRGAAPEALRLDQLRVIDALTTLRTARKNASLEQRLNRQTDVLGEVVRLAARAAVATLTASLALEELAELQAPAESLRAVRGLAGILAGAAREGGASPERARELARQREEALRVSASSALAPEVQLRQAGLLAGLQQVDHDLRELNAARAAALTS